MKFWPTREKKDAMGFEALVDLATRTSAGISASPERAMRCPAVYRGVAIRCEVLGVLPLQLYRRRPDGGKERATDHVLYSLLHDRPNAWTSAAEFVMQIENDCISHGSG